MHKMCEMGFGAPIQIFIRVAQISRFYFQLKFIRFRYVLASHRPDSFYSIPHSDHLNGAPKHDIHNKKKKKQESVH